ncbi:MAG: hypothetical protein NC123_08315 [Butyrivibrio sp.]|nr:hypothetical protein [Acetatifactor muris]MCM1559534.1 hypothetical protein [Butyrivibrio sp.]
MFCKKVGAMQVFCMAVIVIGAVLTMTGCGSDDSETSGRREPEAIEAWEGAQADLNEGKRPREAVYHYADLEYTITYDMGGHITKVKTNQSENLDFLPEAVERVLEADRSYYRYLDDVDLGNMYKDYYIYYDDRGGSYEENWNTQERTITIDASYAIVKCFFSENGSLQREDTKNKEKDTEDTSSYSYDSNGRMIDDGFHKYKYEKDLLLSSMISTYEYGLKWERKYDPDGNIIRVSMYEDGSAKSGEPELKFIREQEYDEAGNLLLCKDIRGHRADDENNDYYETYDIRQYDEEGNLAERCTQIGINGKEYTVKKWEYLYDRRGRLKEKNLYELLALKEFGLDSQADWCNSGGNTELYITEKCEFKYDDSMVKGKQITYRYEANKDFSVVNLLEEESKDAWEGNLEEAYSTLDAGYWTITYYTEEEIEQYLHDQEFSPVN